MKMKFTLVSLCILLSLIACQKNVDSPSTNVVTTVPILQKVLTIDSTRPAPYDTVARKSITYDNQGRISMWTALLFTTTGDTSSVESFKYEYSGNDTVVSRTIYKSNTYGAYPEFANDTTIYLYSNGKLVYDSMFRQKYSVKEYSTRKYSYFPGYVRMEVFNWLASAGTGAYYTNKINFYTTLVNGNIVHQLDTSFLVSNSTPP